MHSLVHALYGTAQVQVRSAHKLHVSDFASNSHVTCVQFLSNSRATLEQHASDSHV